MQQAKILILDQEPPSQLAQRISEILADPAPPMFEVVRADGGVAELSRQARRCDADAAIVVLRPADARSERGLDALARPVFAALPEASPRSLIALLRRGYADFILPPVSREQLIPRLWRSLEPARQRRARLRHLRERVGLNRLIGRSPVFLEQVEKIPVVARYDAGVLITGETGTGKELFARTIHYLSPRCRQPFIPVNCGAIPLELVENELFGHERAAFTGADSARPGLIEEADGGTLFLDEVDALPPAAQIKLLRFLQDGEVRRLGSTRTRRFEVRVVAATNTEIGTALEKGLLRTDLYYRLNVITLRLPRLGERPEDVPLLAQHFLERATHQFERNLVGFSPGAMERLIAHDWPGNVRELEYTVQRAVLMSRSTERVRRTDIELPGGPAPASFREAKARVVAGFERRYVERMLAMHRGNISRAAAAAKKNRRAFWELIRKHGIDAERFRPAPGQPSH